MRFGNRLAVLVVGAVAALPVLASDLTIVYNVNANGKASTATDYFTHDKFRSSDGQHDTIVDTAAGTLVSIDHGRKQYSQTTVAEIEAALAGAAKQMEEALKGVPPALREKMEKMTGGGGAFSVAKIGGGKTIAGYATDRYVITIGPAETESFNAPTLVPPIEPGEMLRLQSLANPLMKGANKAVAELQKVKGMPLLTVTTVKAMGKTFVNTKEATQVKTGALPAGAFDVPAGYKLVKSPLTKMAH